MAGKLISEGAKAAKKLVDSFDDKATNIAGRKTDSISVGKERQNRAKRKKKATETIAGSSFVEALGIPAKTLEQKEASTNSASKLRNTSRDIKGTPAEKRADKKKEAKKKEAKKKTIKRASGGKVGKKANCRSGGKALRGW